MRIRSTLLHCLLLLGWVHNAAAASVEHLSSVAPTTGITAHDGSVVSHLGRVFVFTYKRPLSLERLLRSVNRSEPVGARVDVHVCVDLPADNAKPHAETMQLLEQIRWPRGEFTHSVNNKHGNVVGQWLDCWQPKSAAEGEADDVIFLEDDLELSVHALRWVWSARRRYAGHRDVAVFSLQRQTNCFHTQNCAKRELQLPWSALEYKYKLVGTWGMAPVRDHWREFRAWFHERSVTGYVPKVEHLLPTQWYQHFHRTGRHATMWSMWFLEFCEERSLYNVYYNDPVRGTLSANWREAGAHYGGGKSSPSRDFQLTAESFSEQSLPSADSSLAVVTLDWDGRVAAANVTAAESANIVAHLRAISREQNAATGADGTPGSGAVAPLLTFVNDAFIGMLEHWLCNCESVAPQILARTLLIALDQQTLVRLLSKTAKRWPMLRIAAFGATANDAMSAYKYGTVAYNKMILSRTRLLLHIMEQRQAFILFETDALIRGDFAAEMDRVAREQNAAIVGVHNSLERKAVDLNGGFLRFAVDSETQQLWREVTTRYAANIARQAGRRDYSLDHEQDIFSKLIVSKWSSAVVRELDRKLYVSGREFGNAQLRDSAQLILFNFVVGIEKKVSRSKKHNMWFNLDAETGKCQRCCGASTASRVSTPAASGNTNNRALSPCKLAQVGGRPSDNYGAWTLCVDDELLPSDAVVWSFGVGVDISFELDILSRRPSARVHSFDPTITADFFATLCEGKSRCPRFSQVGLGSESGQLPLYKSKDSRIQSLRVQWTPDCAPDVFMQAPVLTLADAMRENGVSFVDVLKIDVEGVEFAFVESLDALPVRQLAIELHERFFEASARRDMRDNLINKVKSFGFELVHTSSNGEELLFRSLAKKGDGKTTPIDSLALNNLSVLTLTVKPHTVERIDTKPYEVNQDKGVPRASPEDVVRDLISLLPSRFDLTNSEFEALATHFCSAERRGVLEVGSGGSTLLAVLCGVPILHSFDTSPQKYNSLASVVESLQNRSATQWRSHIVDADVWQSSNCDVTIAHSLNNVDTVLVTLPSPSKLRSMCAARALGLVDNTGYLIMKNYAPEGSEGEIEQYFSIARRVESLVFFKRKPMIDATTWIGHFH